MSLTFHILQESGRIKKSFPSIQEILIEAKEKITQVLPVKNVDIIIADNPYEAIPEIGIGGHTYNSHLIVISLDPQSHHSQINLHDELLDTLGHELHHAARWQKIGYGETLFEALITEGLADHFAIEITKRKTLQPWDNALTSQQVDILLEKAKKEYDSKKYNHVDWFFGSKQKKIPKWTAYTLGFHLVGSYIETHQRTKPSLLYATKAKNFR